MLRIALAVLLSCVYAFAQGTTSRVVGLVQDSTGAVVPNAKVKLTNEGTNVSFQTATSSAGTYQFEAVQIGVYSVEVEAAGFKKFLTKGNQLTIGNPMAVNATLAVGQVAEVMEVSGSAEVVQTQQSSNLGPLINQRTMLEMPIVATRRRDPTSILAVLPGMNNGGNTGGGGHMNGARDRAWNFTLDGIDMNEVSAGGGIGNNPIRVNPDSVAEMKIVSSNPSAEFGRNSGAQVSMVTRSGTNEVHGNAFWFYRTPGLNANRWQDNFNGLGRNKFIQHIFGGSVGGPVIKNKLFYFANWQELRATQAITQTATVLTQQARQGIFRYATSGRNLPAGVPGASVDFGGNAVVPVGSYNAVASDPLRRGLDRTVANEISQTPLPNRFDVGDGLNTAGFVFRPIETERQRDLTFKGDYVINDRNTVYGRVYWGFQDTQCDSVNGGLPRVPGAPCLVTTTRDPLNLAFNWRTTPSATITNELVVGISKFKFGFPNPVQDITRNTLDTALITIPNAYTFGNARELRTYQFVDNLSWFRGKHAFKFGINFRFVQHLDERGSIGGQNSAPLVNFSTAINAVDPVAFGFPTAGLNTQFDRGRLETYVNLMLGRVGNYSQGFVADGGSFRKGLFEFDSRFYEYDFYFQDTWRLAKNFTLDFGLRLDARGHGVSGDPNNRILVPNLVPVAGATPSNSLAWSPGRPYRGDWNNFGPSIGFAWDPFESGKTSIRANYRLAYDRIPTFLISSFVLPNMPGSTLGVVNSAFGAGGGRLADLQPLTPTSTPAALARPIPFSNNSNTVLDPNIQTPQTNMWSFSIQREVAKKIVLEASYIGRRAHNLLGGYDANQAALRSTGFLDAFRTVQQGGDSALMNRIFSADSRLRPGETGSQFVRRTFPSELSLNSAGAVANAIARRQQGATNLTEASGLGPFFLMPFPQFSNGMFVIDSNDFSTYHALQVTMDKRFGNGATIQVNYTLAKSLDSRSFDPTFTLAGTGSTLTAANTPVDIYNRKLNYGFSDFDRRHSLGTNFVWELPFGQGKWIAGNASGFWQRVIGGWQVSGLMRYTSGRPFSVFAGTLAFNSVVGSFANCNACDRSLGTVREEGGFKWYFDPSERGKFSQVALGELGGGGRNVFRGPGFFNLDFSLNKRILIRERMNIELRADFSNFTNTPSFSIPTTTLTATTFGRIGASLDSGPRQTMLGMKFNF